MNTRTTTNSRGRRRTTFGLPVEGAIPPRPVRVQRRRHTGAWLGLTAVLLAIVTATVVLRLQSSSFFVVRQVRVLGAISVDRRTVAGLSGVQGKQLYEIDASAVSSTLERLALIQSASVRRVWPNTVEIRVQERQPWGTWQIGGVNYLVDARGVVLDIVPTPWNATVYELDAAPGLRPGDQVDSDAVGMARILLDQLPHTILQQVARLEYSPDAGLEILTDQGVRVRMGDSQGLEFKLAVWQALNTKVGASHIHLLDIRSPEHPFYR